LRSRAENEVLTGLPNRTLFFERLEQTLAKARQQRFGVAVLFLDVDHFKAVNDTFGHPFGDAVLVEFAKRLRHSVRAPDVVARLSGDEFAILVGELDDLAQVEHVAAHIVDTLTGPFAMDDRRLAIGATSASGSRQTAWNRRSRCSRAPTASCIKQRPRTAAAIRARAS
jgi:diguanylate cyclase (GGDEF)-like protein